MELTTVVGGVFAQGNPTTASRRRSAVPQAQNKRTRQSMDSAAGDDTMDMTASIGGILPAISEPISDDADATIGMDLTTAVGGILPPTSVEKRMHAKNIMEIEADLGRSPLQAQVIAHSPAKLPAPVHTIASETGSPSLAAFRGKSLRRSVEAQQSATPKPMLGDGTPIKKPSTPSKQLTPQPSRPKTPPGKTPPSKNIAMRTSSPKRLFKNDIKTSTPQPSASAKKATPNRLFQNDKATGAPTPNFVLTPQRRRSSGIGVDKAGLGSPRVAELLDRRGSIGDQASSFVPSQLGNGGRGVRFNDPRELEMEVNAESEGSQTEEKDATINLKEMIQSMSPKKNPLRGRKSLHVGAARGILGKRPIELDEDDEQEENDGVKRLKGHLGSPVKNVRLQGPPSKEDTTGRLGRPPFSPIKGNTTPRARSQSRDADATFTLTGPIPLLEQRSSEANDSLEDDRIQLQDFLNMTSIRFMELTTTKRRHTIAPKQPNPRDSLQDASATALEDCVAAGAATIPMLELFQHVS